MRKVKDSIDDKMKRVDEFLADIERKRQEKELKNAEIGFLQP